MAKEFIVYSATRASFEALVASGEVDNTQIGIIAESGEFWENGNYHPLVMLSDYLKKTDAVALAKDLTGSIEATPEEFTFRTSAGTKSIRDESAVIRRIKGNTSVWGQLAYNPNFAEGTTGWYTSNSTFEINPDGSLKVINRGTTSQALAQPLSGTIPKGHKVLIVLDHQRSATTIKNVLFYLRRKGGGYDSAYVYNVSSNTRRIDYGIITTTDEIVMGSSSWPSLYIYPFMNGDVGAYSNVYSVNVFDLTALYDAGNEPTTIEEFKKLYPESYYPYCAPEVRSMRATGIETIGANAFNKDSVVGGKLNADGTVTSNDIYSVAKIEVVPYEKYTLTNVANAANTTYTYALYDSEDRFISVGEIKNSVTKPVSVSGDVTMPISARYMRVVVHNDYLDNCCVNLKHSGTLTAEEAVYFKEVRMLPDIAKYFPDGMHGIGEGYDEINEENAVKRFGVVDLGTLEWGTTGTSGGGTRFYSLVADWASKPTGGSWLKGVIKCAKYDTVSADDTYSEKVGIALMPDGKRLQCYDPTYTDATSFKAAMSGVMLVYELAEPIVTLITEPLQLDYKVADFGTEKMLSNLPSSPFRADIVYQFNAADRIRDNARNIERLEEHTKDMATMEDVINAIPTEVATATQIEEYTVVDGSQPLNPNIMYEYPLGIGQLGEFVMPNIIQAANSNYDNRWMLRLPAIATSASLSYTYTIKWKDGIAPNFTDGGTLEIYLKMVNTGEIIGEWVLYK